MGCASSFNIFVSYTTRDYYIDRELLENIFKIVSIYGNCYIDLLHNNENDKQNYVKKMLAQSDLLILISSNSVGKSEWVQWELFEADKMSIPIIVVHAIPEMNETLNNLRSKLANQSYLINKFRKDKRNFLENIV